MSNKIISFRRLKNKSGTKITYDLRKDRYSLLESLGCHEMRKEMRKIGIACRLILWIAEKRAGKHDEGYELRLRESLGAILNWGAPTRIRGAFPHPRTSLVFGFNHPTLGEIIRLIAICVNEYPTRKYLFPVNIVWYEELAPVAHRMEKFGLYIKPTITPSTRAKFAKILDKEKMDFVDQLSREFNESYLWTCGRFVHYGEIIVVAPSATRQATVFQSKAEMNGEKSIEPQTMTLIALDLIRNNNLDCYFVPVAVAPPVNASRRLNLFSTYKIAACDWIPPAIVKRLCKERIKRCNSRKFERYFLSIIADELSELDADELICS